MGRECAMYTLFINDIGDSAELAGKILRAKLYNRKPVPLTLDHERVVRMFRIELDNELGIIVLGRDDTTKETIQIIMPYAAGARATATIIGYPTEDAKGPAR